MAENMPAKHSSPAAKTKPWRSVEEVEAGKAFLQKKHREFPVDASRWPEQDKSTEVSRRAFLKTMAAPLAFAGLSSCGLIRRPEQKIYPYARPLEYLVPGKPNYFATTCTVGEDAVGLLVESHEGRPTKIEGNPLHPSSRGKTQSFHQASVLDLYNPDRLQHVQGNGKNIGRAGLDAWIAKLDLAGTEGEGVGILFPHQTSPTFHRVLGQVLRSYPGVNIYKYDVLGSDVVRSALAEVTTTRTYGMPSPDLEKADVILSLDCDFLGLETGALSQQMAFAKRRNPDEGLLNRLYHYESSFTVTGGMADHRFRMRREDIEFVAYSLLYRFYEKGISRIAKPLVTLLENKVLSQLGDTWLRDPGYRSVAAIVDDLLEHKGRAVIVAGAGQSHLVHALVAYMNEFIAAPLRYRVSPFRGRPELKETGHDTLVRLNDDLASGKITTLINLGTDPVYDVPQDLPLVQNLTKAELLTLTLYPTETSKASAVVVPQAHYLETWSDAFSCDGTLSFVQPLIRPLYAEVLSGTSLLAKLAGLAENEVSLVRQTHNMSEALWRRSLHDGVAPTRYKQDTARRLVVNPDRLFAVISSGLFGLKVPGGAEVEVTFDLDYSVRAGQFFNNAWMQELPDPVTKITWENAALFSYATAKQYNVKSQDLIKLRVGSQEITAPVWVTPGQADNSISLKLGYGQKFGSQISSGSGYNAYSLRTLQTPSVAEDVEVIILGETTKVASVQDHWAIEDEIFEGGVSSNSQNERPLYRSASLEEYRKNPNFAKEAVEVPSLPAHSERVQQKSSADLEKLRSTGMSIYEETPLTGEYQWGLDIDLNSCTGCNACVVACQAENNIPVVGKEMVVAGREMHWLRIDRYFDGDPVNPRMVGMPVMCMQCEQAPCEQVCPVVATVHSEEGLNDMVYNRCVGTRFCSNNCPYKVRRFNFLDYHGRSPHSQKRVSTHIFDLFREPSESLQMQFNPDVTVRMRGVMEKCTYCVQRINYVRSEARKEKRKIVDGEIQTACEQVCPSSSIVFGNIADKKSAVSKRKAEKLNYLLLEELNVKPRTSYKAAVRHFNPAVSKIMENA